MSIYRLRRARIQRVGLPAIRSQRLPEVDRPAVGGAVIGWFTWQFHLQRRLSPAISGEESGWVLRDRRVWGALQNRGVTGEREGVADRTPRVPAVNPLVDDEPDRDPACFRRNIRAGFGADVYRNSTVDPRLGQSVAKFGKACQESTGHSPAKRDQCICHGFSVPRELSRITSGQCPAFESTTQCRDSTHSCRPRYRCLSGAGCRVPTDRAPGLPARRTTANDTRDS